MECTDHKNICSNLKCDFRLVARQRFNFVFNCDPSSPLNVIQLHTVLRYRYNRLTYQTFLVDLWEDWCGFFSGKTHSLLLERLYENAPPFINKDYLCPYTDSIAVDMKNFSSKNIIFADLLPAGQYRVDFYFAEKRGETPFFSFQLYLEVSDNRIWH